MYHKESPIASNDVQVVQNIITLSSGHHCCVSRKNGALASDWFEQGEVGEECDWFSSIGHDDRRPRGPGAADQFAGRRVKLLDRDALAHCVTVSLSGASVKCNLDTARIVIRPPDPRGPLHSRPRTSRKQARPRQDTSACADPQWHPKRPKCRQESRALAFRDAVTYQRHQRILRRPQAERVKLTLVLTFRLRKV